VGNVYSQVSPFNNYNLVLDGSFEGPRTAIGLLAPGENIEMRGLGNVIASDAVNDGTSYAAPHVTGTVALLQQYATQKLDTPGGQQWDSIRARRHEVMKAVLLNSADKIKDDGMTSVNGTPVPIGGFLGMERTVTDLGPNFDGQNPRNWLQSEAYGDDPGSVGSFIPLDLQMGAGHLNAKRALQQFSSGEFDSDGMDVPTIGWDYGHTSGEGDINKYVIAQPLMAGSFISVSLAWDRVVTFEQDNGTPDEYDPGDTFEEWTDIILPADSVINDLDLHLVHAGATSIFSSIVQSVSNDSTIEHLFFQIPTTGQYEIWVNQWDDEATGDGQDYGIAWWAASAIDPSTGDYDGNGSVGPEDYDVWKSNFGTNFADADGNGNGTVDAADYTVWRDNLGSGSIAAVPEPSTAMLLLGLIGIVASRGARTKQAPASQPTQQPASDARS
jgi:hypothetical protein